MKRKYFIIIGLLLTVVCGSAYSRSLTSTLIFQSVIQESGWEITDVKVIPVVHTYSNIKYCGSSITLPYKIPPKTALAISIADCQLDKGSLIEGKNDKSMDYSVKINFENVNTHKTMWYSVNISCPIKTSLAYTMLGVPCTYTFYHHNWHWKTTLTATKDNPNVRLLVTD